MSRSDRRRAAVEARPLPDPPATLPAPPSPPSDEDPTALALADALGRERTLREEHETERALWCATLDEAQAEARHLRYLLEDLVSPKPPLPGDDLAALGQRLAEALGLPSDAAPSDVLTAALAQVGRRGEPALVLPVVLGEGRSLPRRALACLVLTHQGQRLELPAGSLIPEDLDLTSLPPDSWE